MDSIRSILGMYVITVPLAIWAFVYGTKLLRLRQPPDYPVRTVQLGELITDPKAKLAATHNYGRGAIFIGFVLLIGPVLTALNS